MKAGADDLWCVRRDDEQRRERQQQYFDGIDVGLVQI